MKFHLIGSDGCVTSTCMRKVIPLYNMFEYVFFSGAGSREKAGCCSPTMRQVQGCSHVAATVARRHGENRIGTRSVVVGLQVPQESDAGAEGECQGDVMG